MTQILVDDGPADGPAFESAKTLADVIRAVRAEGSPSPRMVTKIEVDGIPLSPQEISDRMKCSVEAFGEIAFHTCPASILVCDALDRCKELLQGSVEQCRAIADQISANETGAAMSQLAEVLRQWQHIQDGVGNSIRALNVDIGTIEVGGRPFLDALGEVRNLLDSIREVIVARDSVLLADLLQYEVEPVSQTWLALLEALHQYVSHRHRASAMA